MSDLEKHTGHPSQQELMLYAEALLDTKTVPPGTVADHVAMCAACSEESRTMLTSLRLMLETPDAEPSFKAQTALMMRVRKEQRSYSRIKKSGAGAIRVARGLSYAAAILIVAVLAFGAALAPEKAESTETLWSSSNTATISTDISTPDRDETLATVRTLRDAVQYPDTAFSSHPEYSKNRRTVDALGADVAAAQEALTRNPGCEQAEAVMNASLKSQADKLRSIYVQGTL